MRQRRRDRRLLLSLIALMGILPSYYGLHACGYSDDDTPTHIFSPDSFAVLFREADASRSSKNGRQLTTFDLKVNPADQCNQESGLDSNTRSWMGYFQKSGASAYEARELVYGDNRESLERLVSVLRSGPESADLKSRALAAVPALAKNRIVRHAVDRMDVDALEYLVYAKECQHFADYRPDPWSDEPTIRLPEPMQELEEKGIGLRDRVKDKSLRLRYAFQIMRLAFFRKDYERVLSIAAEPEVMEERNPLYIRYRILGLKAGALLKTGHETEARYLFGMVAAESSDQRSMALIDFRNIAQDESGFQKTLAYARSDREKFQLHLIRGISDRGSSMEDLEAIRSMDASSPELEYLLVYEISKQEESLLGKFFTLHELSLNSTAQGSSIHVWLHRFREIWDRAVARVAALFGNGSLYAESEMALKYSKFSPQDREGLSRLRQFIARTLQSDHPRDPSLWQSAGAYLSLLLEDYPAVQRYSAAARQSAAGDFAGTPFLIGKLDELDLMRGLMEGAPLDSVMRSHIASTMERLFGKGSSSSRGSGENYQSLRYLNAMLKYRLAGEGREGESLLAGEMPGVDLSSFKLDQVEHIRALFENPLKDALANYLVVRSRVTLDRILSREGSLLIRAGRLEEARSQLSRMSPTGRDAIVREYTKGSSPLQSQYLETYEKGDSAKNWNKLVFVERMLGLLKAVEHEGDSQKEAELYYRIGNGWYGLSHAGNWWILVDDSWSTYYDFAEDAPLLKRAREAYLESAKYAGKHTERGAKALYLAAMTQQGLPDPPPGPDGEYAKPWQGEGDLFRRMERDYSDTRFFDETVKECSYYRLSKN